MFSMIYFPNERGCGQKVCECDSYTEAYKGAIDYIKDRNRGDSPTTTPLLDLSNVDHYDVYHSSDVSYVNRRGERVSGRFVLVHKHDSDTER